MKPLEVVTSRTGRLWLYSTGIGVVGVLTTYGLLTDDRASAWAALLAPLFGLAIANVPNDKDLS